MNIKKTRKHPLQEKMLRCLLMELTGKEIIGDIPKKVLSMYHNFPYKELVRPLIIIDRNKGLTYGQLSVKYQLSLMQLKFMLNEHNLEE